MEKGKKTSKKKEPLKTKKGDDGFEHVIVSHGIEYWKPEKGDSIEGMYMETMERPNTGMYAKQNPIQRNPIIKTKDGTQISLPDNKKIHIAIAQFGVKWYRITFDGQAKGTGEHKGKKFNNYSIAFKDKAPK